MLYIWICIWLNQLSNTTNLWWIDVYCTVINYLFRRLWPSSGWWINKKTHKQLHLACVFYTEDGGRGYWMGVRDMNLCWLYMAYKFIFVPYYTNTSFFFFRFMLIRIAMLTNLRFSCHVTQLCPGNAGPHTDPFHAHAARPCIFWIAINRFVSITYALSPVDACLVIT
jgi:hypothetical protein